ncbi:MAG: M15 family metallopeptidase [Clostridium sp.]|nr:M15 family metallopeptidase [Clostridium sp.]
MKKFIKILVIFLVILQIPLIAKAEEKDNYNTKMKQDILVLLMAYPGYIKDIEKSNDNKVYIVMKSGKKILYDDHVEKSHEEKLANPDISDMLEQIYPLEMTTEIMDKGFDPGRARHYELLSEVYGSNQSAITKNLTKLKSGYTNYQFNSKNGASAALDQTLSDLICLSKSNNKIGGILYPASGTFNYRVISGTGRLSPHAYGIAIDLKSDRRDYWKWCTKEEARTRLLEYPEDLVKTFERNNFVWGGKWGHFDILHFEYRPEIIIKAKYFSNTDNLENWYGEVPMNESNMGYISMIEEKLG